MATEDSKREELIDLLDKKVFDPVLKASDSNLDDEHRRMLADVKRSTRNEKKRFHDNYRSAGDVKTNYLSDLTSEVAKKKDKELEELDLPRMYQVKDEFLKLCDRLHV